ncbi:hypothetical protein RJ641_028154 [Dillenia turbinata]|uniref:Uncharacterized protein n=1 Tax=Dillenia turbinata TaxID=194707 RepID=A0AAN8WBE9_9MAGN
MTCKLCQQMVFLCKTFKAQVNDEALVTLENRQSEIDGSDISDINNKRPSGNKELGKTKVGSPTSRVKGEKREQKPKMEKKPSKESPTSKLKHEKTVQKPKMEEKAKSSTWRVKDEETKRMPKIERTSPNLNLPSEKKNEKGNTDNIQTIDECTNQQAHVKTKGEILVADPLEEEIDVKVEDLVPGDQSRRV